jgi:hypothetical protein
VKSLEVWVCIFTVVNKSPEIVKIVPFWILDFGFWIGKCFLYLRCVTQSIAIIFQIGISLSSINLMLNGEINFQVDILAILSICIPRKFRFQSNLDYFLTFTI